jgi:hypothetical protein
VRSLPLFDSQIISGIPEIFAEFQRKRKLLLWRGSRDGFGASEFHRRCDGHANTLTVILDTNGNVFGGFTPVEWESTVWNKKNGDESNRWKADESRKSFLFSLKNPEKVSARKFALKDESKNRAIYCDQEWGPDFNDIHIVGDCDANSRNCTVYFGTNYVNDTRVKGDVFFTGGKFFQVKEIEVFEIID